MLARRPRDYYGLSLFDDVFNNFENVFNSHLFSNKVSDMRTDVKEKDGSYLLDMDLPGFQKDDIKIALEDGQLTVSATKNESVDEKDQNGKYIRKERYVGQCSRSFYVGNDVSEKDINAKFENGTLQLSFPKAEAKQIEEKKYIEIN